MNHLNGLKLVANDVLTINGPDRIVKRTWRERLFTKPWSPLKATRAIPTRVPDPDLYQIGNTIVGHPATLDALVERMKGEKQHG